jgi:hypothetical protein
MTRILTLVLIGLIVAALGCRGEGPPGKNSDKDRPKPASEKAN